MTSPVVDTVARECKRGRRERGGRIGCLYRWIWCLPRWNLLATRVTGSGVCTVGFDVFLEGIFWRRVSVIPPRIFWSDDGILDATGSPITRRSGRLGESALPSANSPSVFHSFYNTATDVFPAYKTVAFAYDFFPWIIYISQTKSSNHACMHAIEITRQSTEAACNRFLPASAKTVALAMLGSCCCWCDLFAPRFSPMKMTTKRSTGF